MELIQETKNEKKNEGGITLRDIVELVFDNWYGCLDLFVHADTSVQAECCNAGQSRK